MNPRLKEINDRKVEIRSLLSDATKKVDLDALETELRSLDTEAAEIEKRQRIADGINAGSIEGITIDEPALPGTKRSFHGMSRGELIDTPEYRSAFFKGLQKRQLNEAEQAVMGEVRALTVAGGSVPVPTQTLGLVVEKLRQISALYPLISVHNMPGNLAIPVASTLTDAAWTAEATPSTPGDDGTVTVYLSGFTLIKTVEVSVAAYDMSVSAFESYIVDEITQRMAISVENAFIIRLPTHLIMDFKQRCSPI